MERQNVSGLLQAERTILRNELLELKNCQVRYFSISIASTGLLTGLGIHLGHNGLSSIFFLSPLLIILPSWLIFFDKATTITRIVGYCRILENVILEEITISQNIIRYKYVGWENALALFREKQQDEKKSIGRIAQFKSHLKDFRTGCIQLLTFRATHRYWTINWYTFFALSVLCWALGSGLGNVQNFTAQLFLSLSLWLSGILILCSVLYTLYIVGSLNHGLYSYNRNESLWRELLQVENLQ